MDQNTTNHPYTRHEVSDGPAPVTGGRVERYISETQDLEVGDSVFISAAKSVDKSVTAADYQTYVGIVVGGEQTGGKVLPEAESVGTVAAHAGEEVLVQVDGIAYGVADAAVAAGAKLAAGAVAGRLDDSVSATAGQVAGLSLEAAAAAGDAFLVKVVHL